MSWRNEKNDDRQAYPPQAGKLAADRQRLHATEFQAPSDHLRAGDLRRCRHPAILRQQELPKLAQVNPIRSDRPRRVVAVALEVREELRDCRVKGGWRLGLSLVVDTARAFFDHLSDLL